jgi:hypothetical protein
MCMECSRLGDAALCPSCEKLQGEGFPFSRDDFDLSRLFNFALEAFKREWIMLVLTTVVVVGASMVTNVVTQIVQAVVGAVGQSVLGAKGSGAVVVIAALLSLPFTLTIQGFFTLGAERVYLDVIAGKKADVARVFSQGGKLIRYFVMVLIASLPAFAIAAVVALAVGLFVLVVGVGGNFKDSTVLPVLSAIGLAVLAVTLVVVIIPLTIVFTFAIRELVYSDCSSIEALKRAWNVTTDHRLDMVRFFFIAGLIASLSFLLCCVGLLAGLPLGQLLLAGFYMSLRQGSGLPPP